MNTKRAGLIHGSPLCGLCHRECIEVARIFDGCMSRIADRQFTVNLGSMQGTPPFVFVSAASSGATAVSNLVVVDGENGTKSKVECDVNLPITVTYTDSLGVKYTAQSDIGFHREMFLNIPEASMSAYTISVQTALVSNIGSFTAANEVTFRCCILQITKVTTIVDLLVPSYGFCEFPSCDEVGACEAFFNLPLFPRLL